MRPFRPAPAIARATALEPSPAANGGKPVSLGWARLRREPKGQSGSPTGSILEARDLTKRYLLNKETVEAVRGVSLSVAPGEFIALMGPSGSGKSTLLQLLGGLDQPTSGQVVLEGRDISRLSDGQARRPTGKSGGAGTSSCPFFLRPFRRRKSAGPSSVGITRRIPYSESP